MNKHLKSENSSVEKTIPPILNEVKNIVVENDPVNLRLSEAFYIHNQKPTLDSREECCEFADLLF